MPFTKTFLPGVIVFEPKIFPDERGFFFESYNQRLFNDNNVLNVFVQDNQSFSSLWGDSRITLSAGTSCPVKTCSGSPWQHTGRGSRYASRVADIWQIIQHRTFGRK